MKRSRLLRKQDAAQLKKWCKSNRVSKPLIGGQTPNRPRLANARTVEVLTDISRMSIRDFAETYDK